MVWSRDAATGTTQLKPLTQTFERYATTLALTFSNGETVETTREHPFYVESEGFVNAGELGIGTSIVTRAGPSVRLVSVSSGAAQTVYNFEVADYHTYFVGQGEVWVHNALCGQIDWSIVKQSTGETRAAHVQLHNVDNLNKPDHGIFYADGIPLVEEAWQKAIAEGLSKTNGGGTDELIVDMGRAVGRAGGSNAANQPIEYFYKIKIVFESGTNKLITAFPVQ